MEFETEKLQIGVEHAMCGIASGMDDSSSLRVRPGGMLRRRPVRPLSGMPSRCGTCVTRGERLERNGRAMSALPSQQV